VRSSAVCSVAQKMQSFCEKYNNIFVRESICGSVSLDDCHYNIYDILMGCAYRQQWLAEIDRSVVRAADLHQQPSAWPGM
jgi:hypothetical protein